MARSQFAQHWSSAKSDAVLMSDSISLTSGAVELLLRHEVLDEQCYVLQILRVMEGTTVKGGRRDTLTVSDGVHHLDCFCLPNLFSLLDSEEVSCHSAISISKVSYVQCSEGTNIVILDVTFMAARDDIIGSPVTLPKCTLESENNAIIHRKRSRSNEGHELQKHFQAQHNEVLQSETLDGPDASHQHPVCEHCNNVPCDWAMYGLEVVNHVIKDYTDDGHPLANTSNKQLRYYCYTAFTSMKHGYLGKKKRIPFLVALNVGFVLSFRMETLIT
jgi:hypothetical protein